MSVRRRNDGLLAGVERRVITYLLPRLPESVLSDHLTGVALFGAIGASFALIEVKTSVVFLPIFVFGMFLNWLGDSLDGALARYRRCERHKIGFLLDKTCDLLSLGAVVLAMGQSGFMSPFASLMLVIAYLLHTIYSLLRVVVDGVQVIGIDGFGATEGRISAIIWVGLNVIFNFGPARWEVAGMSVTDTFCVCAACFVLVRFLRSVGKDIERLQALEGGVHPRAASLERQVPAATTHWSVRQTGEAKAAPTRSPIL